MGIYNLNFANPAWRRVTQQALFARVPTVLGPELAQFRDNGAGSTGVFALDFDAALEESVFFSITSPTDYYPGTDIYPVLSWSTKTTEAAKQVCWGLEITYSGGDDDLFGETTIIYQDTANHSDLNAYAHNHSVFAALSGAAFPGFDNIAMMRVFRDGPGNGGTDSFTADATLISFNMVYRALNMGPAQNSHVE